MSYTSSAACNWLLDNHPQHDGSREGQREPGKDVLRVICSPHVSNNDLNNFVGGDRENTYYSSN